MHVSLRFQLCAFSLLLVAACGGGGASATPKCTPGAPSVPNGVGDPCAQDFPQCTAINGKAIATCDATGTWGTCMCIAPTAPAATSGAATATGPICGNGMIEGSEQCEQGMTGNKTCATLIGVGSMGLVQCKNCMIDMSGCTAPVPVMMVPTAGMGPTGGAGH